MRLNDRQKFFVIIGVFSLVLIGEGVFAYFSWNARGKAMMDIARLDAEQRDAVTKRKLIPGLENNARELANIIEEYVKILPTDAEVGYDAFLEDVDGFTRNTDLKIKKATPIEVKEPKKSTGKKGADAKSAPTKKFQQYKYRFELSGTFLGLLKFINAIENHSRFLQVDAVEIKPSGAQRSIKHEEEVAAAENSVKNIVVEISTYTYSKSES